MSVYNGLPYLNEAIETILAQTYTDFEFIIIDDCSSDRSWEILQQYATQDQRIKLFKNETNLGLTKSLNRGIGLAQGEYIARQDADDVALPERFAKQVTLLDQQPKTVLASCNVGVINPQGDTVAQHQRACESQLVAWHLIFHNYVAGHSQVMFRRKLVLELGGYCEARRYSQDYELWCRLAEQGNITILPEILQQQRVHKQSVSAAKAKQQTQLSLSQSQRNIEQLTGKQLSLEQVADLRRFWIGSYWWSNFPSSIHARLISNTIFAIYSQFIQKKTASDLYDSDLSPQIKKYIGQQFIRWIRQVSIVNLRSRLRISFYALAWHPLGVIGCWIQDIWRLPMSKLRLIQAPAKKPPNLNAIRQGSSSTD